MNTHADPADISVAALAMGIAVMNAIRNSGKFTPSEINEMSRIALSLADSQPGARTILEQRLGTTLKALANS